MGWIWRGFGFGGAGEKVIRVAVLREGIAGNLNRGGDWMTDFGHGNKP